MQTDWVILHRYNEFAYAGPDAVGCTIPPRPGRVKHESGNPVQCRTQGLPNPADISNLKLESELNTETTTNLSQTGDGI